jgi:Rad3-related DNA helicase
LRVLTTAKNSEKGGCCEFFGREGSVTNAKENALYDIEDLVSTGKILGGCPYYASKSLAAKADIVFLPYNYVFDPVTPLLTPKIIRKVAEVNLRRKVLIVDEAHNIEGIATEAASIEVHNLSYIFSTMNGISSMQKEI